MASWILVPSLVTLRSEFNAINPDRDKASDGSVGDAAHADSESDHNPDETGHVPIRDADGKNEVHAIDVDVNLRVPGLDMEDCVQFILGRCRSGAERRLRYIIYRRRIWSASNGWRQKAYTGSNAHDQHAHFSASYETVHEASTASWHLEDIPVALTPEDKTWISGKIREIVRAEMITTAEVTAAVPTADENGKAAFSAIRNSPTTGISDTGANLIASEITKAVKDGKVIQPFPNNEGKSLGDKL